MRRPRHVQAIQREATFAISGRFLLVAVCCLSSYPTFARRAIVWDACCQTLCRYCRRCRKHLAKKVGRRVSSGPVWKVETPGYFATPVSGPFPFRKAKMSTAFLPDPANLQIAWSSVSPGASFPSCRRAINLALIVTSCSSETAISWSSVVRRRQEESSLRASMSIEFAYAGQGSP